MERSHWSGRARAAVPSLPYECSSQPFFSPFPNSSRSSHLFSSLTAAGLTQDRLPFNVGLVVGVDGGVDVESVLQVLTGTGVQHGPLRNH